MKPNRSFLPGQRRTPPWSAELLPVPYFHIIFTLPHELCSLILQNKRLLYDLLFRTSAASLRVHDLSAPVARGHAPTCKGVVRPKAVQVLSIWRLLTHGRRQFCSSKPLPLRCRRALRPKPSQSARRRH